MYLPVSTNELFSKRYSVACEVYLPSIFSTECTAIGRLAGLEGTDVYCHRKCLRYPSECPMEECECVEKIDPSDPINVLDQSSNNFKYISEFKNKNGHAVEEFQEVDGEKYKIISVY